jgi:hypothetical protein
VVERCAQEALCKRRRDRDAITRQGLVAKGAVVLSVVNQNSISRSDDAFTFNSNLVVPEVHPLRKSGHLKVNLAAGCH